MNTPQPTAASPLPNRRPTRRHGLHRSLATLLVAGLMLTPTDAAAGAPSGPTVTPAANANPAAQATSTATSGRFDPDRYEPAVLRLSVSPDQTPTQSIVDLTLVPVRGELVGRRVTVATQAFGDQLRELYGRLARQLPMEVDNPSSPARQLYRILLEPLAGDLQRLGVTTLLISADPGLQAIPFAALHDGNSYVGERFALSLTPSLGLMPLSVPQGSGGAAKQLAVGASSFEGLAPLPLVPQELDQVSQGANAEHFLNGGFTPSVLLNKAADENVNRVHVATHAEFRPGGPAQARLYTGTGPMSLSQFANLRQRRAGSAPLDLLALSACRTALGDKDSELGFAGLALQAGARSAIGTLWYVDDVATSAFFSQFYRHLNDGLPKAEALQATRQDMANGTIRLEEDRVIGPGGNTLLRGLSPTQQRRIETGLRHPFFWAGITLLGTPW